MEENDKIQLKPLHGVIIFAVFMAIFLTLGVKVQRAFGLWGVALTEAAMLVFSIIVCLLLKQDMREVFPLKKTSLQQIFGVVLFGLGASLAGNLTNIITMYFFPAAYVESATVNSLYATVPMVWAVIIMSVMPGVCEEALHRGLILHTMKPIKSFALKILIMGVIFGLFHVSVYRFLPTAVLGAALTFIMLKTGNFALPAIYHFLNNFTALALAAMSAQMLEGYDVSAVTITAANVGAYMFIGAAAPFLLYKGAQLMSSQKPSYAKGIYIPGGSETKKDIRAFLICAACSLALAAAGILLVVMFVPQV